MKKVCAQCSKEYPAEKSKSKFCSINCSSMNQSKKIIKTCEYCKIDYSVPRYREKTSRFCKSTCREKAQYKPGFDGENKICTSCKELKPLTDFWKRRTKCKSCLKDRNREWYENNKEHVAIKGKEYRENNFEKLKAQKEEYKKANKENYRRYLREWKKRNKEKVKIDNRIATSVRRARLLSLPYDFSQEDWDNTLEHFDFRCSYCGSNDKLQQEHVIPLSSGGGTTRDNIIPACSICNNQKNNKDFEDWYFGYEHFSIERLVKIKEFIEHNTEESPTGNGSESVESRGRLKL
ncbi:HNH endonuclease signature motif containing protein [Peribacillus sp. NJ4]|uniref:HNH endonuclease n=1 Tax=Peribacillus sp. NJ4 TaxID=3055862 RepID=UPI0025A0BC76|nr:HNH endonuclease signature motif containing protein [Peribacillus sp. NJ4]MDM5212646.1 HNH endonuclease signature motif containing protein [Peribacillus sp. NJ4]